MSCYIVSMCNSSPAVSFKVKKMFAAVYSNLLKSLEKCDVAHFWKILRIMYFLSHIDHSCLLVISLACQLF